MTETRRSQRDAELKPIVLLLRESDLAEEPRARVRAIGRGEKVLGGTEDDSLRVVFDALPAAIAKRVQAITPPGFVISHIDLALKVVGKLPGIDLGGDITIRLSPKA